MSKLNLESVAAEFRSGNIVPVERATFTRERMQEVLEAYADARMREAQQWISVEDRLPNDGDSVMFAVDCQNPGWHHLHGKVLGGTYRDSGFGVPGLSIGASHWMSLPAPPTE